MTKFEKVYNALMTNEQLRLTTNVDARHSGKYTTQCINTGNVQSISYKTLNEVINAYGLLI